MNTNIAVFGGGCFWCAEAVFKMIRGVISVAPGYAGGNKDNPTYYDVASGRTGHAEVIRVEYDPTKISFRDLLTVFFGSHDPTTPNQQGDDVGEQYRSIILCADQSQRQTAEDFIKELNMSAYEGKRIETEVNSLQAFYPAEVHHQDYYSKNPENSYCQLVINPKLKKVQEKFAKLLKDY